MNRQRRLNIHAETVQRRPLVLPKITSVPDHRNVHAQGLDERKLSVSEQGWYEHINKLFVLYSDLTKRVPTISALTPLLQEIEEIRKNIGVLSSELEKVDPHKKTQIKTEDLQKILQNLPTSVPQQLKTLLADREQYKAILSEVISDNSTEKRRVLMRLNRINKVIILELNKYDNYSKQLSQTLNAISNITKLLLKAALLDPESLPEDVPNMTDRLQSLIADLSILQQTMPTLDANPNTLGFNDQVDEHISKLDDIPLELKANISGALLQLKQLIGVFEQQTKDTCIKRYQRNIPQSMIAYSKEIRKNVANIKDCPKDDLITLLEIINEKLQTIREQLNYINTHLTIPELQSILLTDLQNSLNALNTELEGKAIPPSEIRDSITRNTQFITNQIKVIQAQQSMLASSTTKVQLHSDTQDTRSFGPKVPAREVNKAKQEQYVDPKIIQQLFSSLSQMIGSQNISSEERQLYLSKRADLAIQFAGNISKIVEGEQKKQTELSTLHLPPITRLPPLQPNSNKRFR